MPDPNSVRDQQRWYYATTAFESRRRRLIQGEEDPWQTVYAAGVAEFAKEQDQTVLVVALRADDTLGNDTDVLPAGAEQEALGDRQQQSAGGAAALRARREREQ